MEKEKKVQSDVKPTLSQYEFFDDCGLSELAKDAFSRIENGFEEAVAKDESGPEK